MKLKIDTETLIKEFFEDTVLLGIVAPVKDYILSWQLNQMMGFDFRVNHEIEIQLTKKGKPVSLERQYYFPIYEYKVPSSVLKHFLYNNEYDGEFLLPEFKHLDFLWLVKYEPISDQEKENLIQSIRSLPSVQLVTEMTNEKIRNKQNLIF